MIGPGKYDDVADIMAHAFQCDGLLLIVSNGKLGSGVSCKLSPEGFAKMPKILRRIADEMEKDIAKAAAEISKHGGDKPKEN